MINTLAFISPGGGELILVMLVLIMLFGAKDAPRMLRKIQHFMDEVRRIANGFRYDMMYSDLHAADDTDPVHEHDAADGEAYDFEEDYGCQEEPATEEPHEDVQKTDQ